MSVTEEVRSHEPSPAPSRPRSYLKMGLIGLLLLVVGFVGWTGFKLWRSWQNIERVPFDLEAARERLGEPAVSGPEDDPGSGLVRSEPIADTFFDSFLIVGSDARAGFGGQRADVIMLFLLPDGQRPAVVSLPRDLYLPSPCGGTYMRINANFNGCGDDANGPELLSLAVQDFTGIEVDHFALFDFDGFKEVIDTVGGVTICVDNEVRDFKAELSLPAGCTDASGAQALGWVRTRQTQELVNGSWQAVPGQSDLTRNIHQQDVIFQLFDRLKEFGSLGQLTDTVDSLSDAFTISDGLSLPSALSLAWEMRDIEQAEIARLEISVAQVTTSGGASVLEPTKSFGEILDEAYPDVETVAAPPA